MLKSCESYFIIFELVNELRVNEWVNELWLMYNKNDINNIEKNSMCMPVNYLISNLNMVERKKKKNG